MLSNEWTEWHLTPEGWVSGSERRDFGNITEVTPPPGSVVVYRYNEQMSSMFSDTDRFVSHVSGNTKSPEVTALLARFGPCPERL